MNYQLLENYNDVLTPEDLIEILKVGRNTVYRLLAEGKIKSLLIGGKYRIPKTYLLDYFKQGQFSA